MAHVEKRTRNGKTAWRARYRKPNGREASKTFDRKSDAPRFLNEIEVSKAKGMWIDPRAGKVLFRDWSTECLAARIDLRESSKARDDAYVRGHLLPRFGDFQVAGIERAHVQEWVNDLSDAGLAPATVRACHRLLSGMLAEAVEARIIGQSPCRTIRLPRIQRTEQQFLTVDEIERLVEAAPAPYRALILSAAYLGCRWGELAGLQRASLNLLKREVSIVGTLEDVKGRVTYVPETKTSASRRQLTIPPFLVEVLARHLELAPESDFVFTGPDGGALRRSNFRRRQWKPSVARAGLDDGLRFHDLRHTHAALLIAAGAHVKEIQDRLGHTSVVTTMNVYGHLMPGLGSKLDEALENARQEAAANLPRPHRGPTPLSVVANG